MLFTTSSVMQAALLFTATMLPVVNGIIAVGNQIRDDGRHYNVAWQEGISPCMVGVPIAPEGETLCNQNFRIDGVDYYLVGCKDTSTGYAQEPARLRRVSDDSLYGHCTAVEKKNIDCTGNTHNVIKRYLCE